MRGFSTVKFEYYLIIHRHSSLSERGISIIKTYYGELGALFNCKILKFVIIHYPHSGD